MLGDNVDVKVLIRCETYNHASYIKTALDGFCAQQTGFPFICTIENDASTDNSRATIADYLKTNFNTREEIGGGIEETDDYILTVGRHKTNKNCWFAVYELKYNHFLKKDKMPYLKRWFDKAKYIAWCDGDDCWVDPESLNEKVIYLEEHPDCGLAYSKAVRIDAATGRRMSEMGSDCVDFRTLLKKNDIPSVTVVWRADMERAYIKEMDLAKRNLQIGDYQRWLWLAEKKGIKFFDKVTAEYRMVANSASHMQDGKRRVEFIDLTAEIQKFFAARSGIKFDDGWVNQNYKYVLCKRLAGMAKGEKCTAEELALMYSRVKGITWRMWLSYWICRMGLAGRWMEKLGIVKKKWSG